MRRVSFALALEAFLCACVGGCGDPGPSGPNVIVLVMDTTRGDRISATGYDRETAPHLNAILAESTVYLDAWSPAGWTGPAHASLFTGLRPEHHGYLRGTRDFLLDDSDTLAERFRAAGYMTACFSNNDNLAPEFGLTQGFGHVVPLYANESRPYPWAPETHRRALDWAARMRGDGKRFFLFINDMEPHFPYTPPEADREALVRTEEGSYIDTWGRALEIRNLFEHNFGLRKLSRERLEHVSDLYDAEIRCLDAAIGDLFDRLRKEGLLEDTVVVVTSDHGENLGDHGLMDHLFSLHRSICHVPLLICYPEYFPKGLRVQEVVRLEDIAPTLLQICGLEPLGGIDGQSLLENLPGRVARASLGPPMRYLENAHEEHPVPFDSEPFHAHLRSVYDGRYHLIRYSDGREEFYDVSEDPAELLNLAPRGGKKLDALRGLIAR